MMIRSSLFTPTQHAALIAARAHQLAEPYETLLERARALSGIRVGESLSLGVSCSFAGEGVSTVVANLAAAAALESDSETLVVDAHFARPRAPQLLHTRGVVGLADLIDESANLAECLRVSGVCPRLHVLPAGSAPARQQARLTTSMVRGLLKKLHTRYSLVLWDLPPASPGSAALAAAPALHGVILVVEAERVRAQAVQSVKDNLLEADAKLLGVLFNKRRQHVPDWLYQRL